MSGRGNDPARIPEAALRELARERLPELIAEAEELALARARERLGEEFLRAFLAEAADRIAGEARPRPAHEAPRPAREAPRPSAPQPLRDQGEGCYAYGIVAAGVDLPEGIEGVGDGAAPQLLEAGGLAAIVSRVPLAEFGEEALRENLEDLDWLERNARAHERVLEAALETTTVVPLRLCTIYVDAEQVRSMLEREQAVLGDALARLEGKVELGVKAIVAEGRLEEEARSRVEDSDATGASAGMRYINRKRDQAQAREVCDEIADAWALEIHQPLAELADEALLNPLQRPEVGGHQGEMILNGVYLVGADAEERFRAAAAELDERFAERGVSVQPTGPWPAYNFVDYSVEAAGR